MTVKELQNDPYKLYAKKVATVESGNNPNARNPYGSAAGLFQFTTTTFRGVSDRHKLGYSAEDRLNPQKAAKAFELFTRDNANAIKGSLGHEPTDADLYLAHFLGSGGANSFFKTFNQNPNAPISTVMSPAAIAANKNVVYDKQGKLKTVAGVYNWAQNKMNITPTNVEQELPKESAALELIESRVELTSAPEIETKKEDVEKAKEELTAKTNEFNFINDYLNKQQPITAPQQEIIEIPQQEEHQIDLLAEYSNISNFVQNPLMQVGGSIPVSSRGMYDYPNQPVIVPSQNGSITMKNIPHKIQATSLETGETKTLLPNMQYLFSKTKNILEIPIK